MQRSLESSFLGGAVVFPGGRVEPSDREPIPVSAPDGEGGTWWDDDGRAARVAACREALEEVGLAPVAATRGSATANEETLAALRRASGAGAAEFRAPLERLGLGLDLAALVPLSRWVTPEAEARRFDARFFVARAPAGQEPRSDDREAIRVFWATPSALLAAFTRGEIALFPPTHRTLELLVGRRNVDDAIAWATDANLAPICPRFALVDGVPILALPGDPLHEVREKRIAGGSRYVLRDTLWVSEDPR